MLNLHSLILGSKSPEIGFCNILVSLNMQILHITEPNFSNF